MRKIREILRLGLLKKIGNREIARSCSISASTVGNYLKAALKVDLTYERVEQLNDDELKGILKGRSEREDKAQRAQPNWSLIHEELRRKGVTLQLLWEEYKEGNADGYQSSQFYEYYNRWKKKLSVSMRQTHKAGEKLFIDYSGQTFPIINKFTGEVDEAELFIAVLGASNYTYAEATISQRIKDWIHSHIRAFEYFGGIAEILVPDNLKSGVTKACRYEPSVNPTYHEMAVHYGTVIIPTRVRAPKDKAKAEVGVQIAQRWILAALRNRKFFSLQELNIAILELLEKLNSKAFQKLNGSRLSWFESMEKSALLPLPQTRYVFAQWKKTRVNLDYHVELEQHYYSVPYTLVHKAVQLRYTACTVEIFYQNNRVASHKRNDAGREPTTLKEHMPKSHQKYIEWSPTKIIQWAGATGESTLEVVEAILKERHPELGYRSCMGIMRLGKQFSDERLEKACKRALSIGGKNYKSIKSILEKGLDRLALPSSKPHQPIDHENIRGSKYFH